MQIVPEILKKVELAGAKVLAVTKYFSPEETSMLVSQLKQEAVVLGFGENRIADIRGKSFDRSDLHFIGNIQSRDIPDIARYCSVVHSLCSLKHAEIFAQQKEVLDVFIQINISREEQKSGIMPEKLEQFLQDITSLSLNIVGISAIGAGDFTPHQKRKEFQELVSLRNSFFPGTKISAGTSRDFEIALEEGIEIVRIGQALVN
jgi:uncharacterized pyridoxal phosphate-containing UPF0001 family protein